MKIPARPADPFAPAPLRPAESVQAHATTPEDIQRAAKPGPKPGGARGLFSAPEERGPVISPAPQTDKERALDLVGREGLSYAAAARTVKRPAPTVFNWCKLAKVTPGCRRTEPMPPRLTAQEQRQQERQEAREAVPVALVQGEEVLDRLLQPGARQDAPTQAEAAVVVADAEHDAPAGVVLSPTMPASIPPVVVTVRPAAPRVDLQEPEPAGGAGAAAPPRPPDQHWEVYVGPPRQVPAERELERLRLRLQQVEQGAGRALHTLRFAKLTHNDERVQLAAQLLEAALAPAPQKAGGAP